MKNSHAFTLIELLVVVLIIGILAAVALPQYQKAVAKSRFAALKPLAKAVKDAEEIYFDANGTYGALADLDVQAPAGASLTVGNTDGHDFVRASDTNLKNRYTLYFNHSENFAGNVYCEAEQNDSIALAVCEGEQGQDANVTRDGYKWYLLSGSGTGSFPYKLMSKSGYPYPTYTYSNGNETIEVLDVGTGYMINGKAYSIGLWIDERYGDGYKYADLCEKYPFVAACKN